MTNRTNDDARAHFRVDKFAVPEAGREEFLGRVSATHRVLRRQGGFVKDYVFERHSGPGEFNFVTLVEWASADAIERAAEAVAELHASLGFDRKEMMARLGIRADIANYEALDV